MVKLIAGKVTLPVLLVALLACERREGLQEQTVKMRQELYPMASVAQVDSLSKRPELLPVSLARNAALYELVNFKEEFSKGREGDSLYLAKRPIVIEEAGVGAQLYEFLVFTQHNEAIATITSHARREACDYVASVLPFVRDYTDPGARWFSPAYPEAGSSVPHVKTRAEEAGIPSAAEVEEFWEEAQQWHKRLGSLTDAEVVAMAASEARALRAETRWYTIPAFDRDNLQRTRFSGACGPGALAWIYRGLFTHFQGEYIPLHGEYPSSERNHLQPQGNANTSLYRKENSPLLAEFHKFDEFLGIKGAMGPCEMVRMVETHFPNCYVQVIPESMPIFPRQFIEKGHPVYLLVFSSNAKLHYIVGFGVKKKLTLWGKFVYDAWLLVTDNGTQTAAHGYLPYYRNAHALNARNQFFGGGAVIKVR